MVARLTNLHELDNRDIRLRVYADAQEENIMKVASANNENGKLQQLFHKILKERDLAKGRIAYLVDEYAETDTSSPRESRKKKSAVVSALKKDELTWGLFMFLIFKVLRMNKMVITVDLYSKSGKTTHSLAITDEYDREEPKESKDGSK